jgi:hypothetical protein
MWLFRKLLIIGKWPALFVLLFIVIGILGWVQAKIGFDGWSNVEEFWSGYGSIASVVKYAVVILVGFNWKGLCSWYGRYSGNAELGEKLEGKWHLFLVVFVVVELVRFLR